MTAPWTPYSEHQPLSADGITLVEAFGQLMADRWDFQPYEVHEALTDASDPDGDVPAIAIVRPCATSLHAAILDSTLRTYARPIAGGKTTDIPAEHWKIDDILPRLSTGCFNLASWTTVDAEPTHRIFVRKANFEAFMNSLMSEDEAWKALDQKPAKWRRQQVSANPAPNPPAGSVVATTTDAAPYLAQMPAIEDRIVRKPEVLQLTGLSNSTIHKHIEEGAFPQSVALGTNSVGWYLSDITKWMQSRRPPSPS